MEAMGRHNSDQLSQFTRISQLLWESGLEADEANELGNSIPM